MDLSTFDNLIMVLTAAVAVCISCMRFRLPTTIGYLLIGILVGPHALGLLEDVELIRHLAEFGVVFLMFTIGLEFSLSKIIKLKHLVFGLGSLQVVLTTLITTAMGRFVGMTLDQSLTVGCIVAMSSTAIVSKQLTDENQLGTLSGQSAISILLFQDLAVIPAFILLASFSQSYSSIQIPLLVALGKTLLALSVIFAFGRWLLRPLFRIIIATESLELFTLSVLLITLGAAYLTQRLELSLALGAFVAGMMLGETEFRHQIDATIRPFRDVLLGLFFITIGALFNLEIFVVVWPWVLLLLTALTVGKFAIIALLSYGMNRNPSVALRTGLFLAQGGEFGFALLSLAMREKLLPDDYGQVVLSALLLSMILAPLIIRYHKVLVKVLLPSKLRQEAVLASDGLDVIAKTLKDHVILCGFGSGGQQLARLLDDESVPYLGIDLDHHLVMKTQNAGFPVIYGDATLYDLLVACKIRQAKALVINFEVTESAAKIIEQVRSHHRKLPIFVRTADDSDLEKLQKLGATEVVPSTLETSIILASHLLVTLGIPAARITRRMNSIRKNRYRLLREVIPSEEGLEPFA